MYDTKFSDLGNKICIIGPSSTGKSTLAEALSKKLQVPAYHLDQFAHIPNTNWTRSNESDFASDHAYIIKELGWVIDGNYGRLMPERFKQATAIIWLDLPLAGCLYRYAIRSFIKNPNRPGGLDGAQKEFSWGLVKYTILNYPKNKLKYKKILKNFGDKPLVVINSFKELKRFYDYWELN